MNPQEQRVADALIERVRQKRDAIDPELAQRIHQGLHDAPDAFYLLAQAAVAQGVQIEALQTQAPPIPIPQQGWQGQPPPQKPGFLESIFGSDQPALSQGYYGQPPGYPGSPQPPAQPAPVQSAPGQPLGSAGYQAVNSSLPGANYTPAPAYPPQYGQPYQGQPQPYPPQNYGAAYPNAGYPQSGYGPPPGTPGYPPQQQYQQTGYGPSGYPPASNLPGAYMPSGNPAYPQTSGYPAAAGWPQLGGGGGPLGGIGGVVAGAAAGALVTGAVESAIHGYEDHERREEQVAREEHHDHNDSWRQSDREHGLADTSNGPEDSSFYNPARDASRSDDEDASTSRFTDTDSDRDNANFADTDSSDDDSNRSDDDASDFGGFRGDDAS